MRRFATPLLASLLFIAAAMAEEASLRPVPEPPIEGLEPAVQERLRAAREAVVSAVDAGQMEATELAALFGNAGMVFHAHHSFEVAEVCYQNALALDSEEIRWPYYLGFLYQDTGRFEEALAAYERVLESLPDDPLASLRVGEVRLALNQLLEAEPYLERARGVGDLEAAALAGLGKIAMGKGQLEAAVERYERAIALQPEANQLYYPLALALRRLDRTDAAKEAIAKGGRSKVEARDGRLAEIGSLTVSSEMFMTSGARAIKAGRLDQAAVSFRGAIAARPENARAHLNLAVVLRQLGDLDAAETSARRALELQPDYFFAHFNLGEILEEKNEIEAAVENYRAALALDANHIQANLRMAAAQMRQGDFEEAVRHYEVVVERAPALIAPRYLLTLAKLGAGQVAAARVVAADALTVHPEEPKLQEAWIRLVSIDPAATSAEVERALQMAVTGQQQQPTFAGAESLACVLAAAGRFEEAVALQSRLIEQLPAEASPSARELLEENLRRFRSGKPAERAWP